MKALYAAFPWLGFAELLNCHDVLQLARMISLHELAVVDAAKPRASSTAMTRSTSRGLP